MSQDPKKSESSEAVNLLLPEGLSKEDYHSLSRKIVGDYVVLSELKQAPPENSPILNDSTWTLTIPASSTKTLADIKSHIRRIPEAANVKIETTVSYGVSTGEDD